MLPSTETRFAAVRRRATRFLSSPVCCPTVGSRRPRGGSVLGDTDAPHAWLILSHRYARPGPKTHCKHKALVLTAKLVADLSRGYFQALDYWRACCRARKLDSRSYVAIPHACCPRRSAATLWVGRMQDEGPSSGILWPRCLVHPCTAIRKDGSANAPRATASYEEDSAARAELFADDEFV